MLGGENGTESAGGAAAVFDGVIKEVPPVKLSA